MTNMGGVGLLLGLLLMILVNGIWLLVIFLIGVYVIHRVILRWKKKNETNSYANDGSISYPELFRRMVLQPDLLFSQISDGETDLIRPLVLITVGGLLFTLGFFSMVFPGSFLQAVSLGLELFFFMGILVYSFWIILAGFFYLLSEFFKGKGIFTTTFQNCGYGTAFFFGMSGFFQLFIILGYQFISAIHILPLVLGSSIQSSALQSPAIILPLIWSIIPWSFGLKHARMISLPRAVTTVSIVVLLSLFLFVGLLLPAFTGQW